MKLRTLPVRNGCADSWLANSDLDDAHGYALILVALGVAKRELETIQQLNPQATFKFSTQILPLGRVQVIMGDWQPSGGSQW